MSSVTSNKGGIACFWYSRKRTAGQFEEDEEELEDHSWITWFCKKRGKNFLCRVNEDFIKDEFNLNGLRKVVPYYDLALNTILDEEVPYWIEEEVDDNILKHSAEMLYGLIHARYILTPRGLKAMSEKFENADFGFCPRVLCKNQYCLPVGISDKPHKEFIKIYCPNCQDVYDTFQKNKLDGAYVGTTFPHLFYMYFPSIPTSEVK
ncbi:Casein kinase II beta-4 subunit, putative, expressed [Zostera marina]|uniref:Casein kinase II subunit beta n=1 Tax=Zostera marina TaxID=29655 RepID=A0A0K9NYU0_ZOSMR|nr:Casein kinase II beta-4 subunit, putative, expressed [Zostera marina]